MADQFEFSLPPRQEPAAPIQRPPSRWPLVAVILLSTVIIVQQIQAQRQSRQYQNAKARKVTPRGDLAASEKSTIQLFKRTAPSVVFITTAKLGRDRFSFNVLEIPQGTGSGFIWDQSGHIVTNYHVIKGADKARVTLSDQSTWDAELVGAEPDKDLAVLRIKAPQKLLIPIEIGRSSNLNVGQHVLAIGNPFGLDHTLTTGVISGLNREIKSVTKRPIQGVIQTDAAINPGNSGGPLLDSAGRLIGVNTAIYSPSGAYAGIGFAVPVNAINRIVPELIRYGKITKPGFGISLANPQFLKQRGATGVLVHQIMEGSAAAKAGMQPTRYDQRGRVVLGDIIIKIDEINVTDADDLYQILDKKSVGDSIQVTVKRGQEETQLQVKLQALK